MTMTKPSSLRSFSSSTWLLGLACALALCCDLGTKKPRESNAAPASAALPESGASGGTSGTGGSAAPTPTGGSPTSPGASGGAGGANGAACANDGDCRLFADYCTGCDCRALARGESDPTCAGPGVRCFADPCLQKKAACQKGHCVTVAATGHDPCAGKKCGETCKICPPSDPGCMETLEVKQCNAEGKCTSLPPACGGK
jgi:hypothetical protein